jgi:hypothetical protein
VTPAARNPRVAVPSYAHFRVEQNAAAKDEQIESRDHRADLFA